MKYNLSEITDVIRNRRTIYPEQFSDRKVHQEQIELLLNNAIWAPTHGNTQPWRFKVFIEDARQNLSDFLVRTYCEVTPEQDQNDESSVEEFSRDSDLHGASKKRENIGAR